MVRKPVITVVGSTSKQGYSVAKSLLETGAYTVRALTRNPEGECAPRPPLRSVSLLVSRQRTDSSVALQHPVLVWT